MVITYKATSYAHSARLVWKRWQTRSVTVFHSHANNCCLRRSRSIIDGLTGFPSPAEEGTVLMRGCGAASPASAPSRSWFKVFFGFVLGFFFARAVRATNAREGSRVSFGFMCGNFYMTGHWRWLRVSSPALTSLGQTGTHNASPQVQAVQLLLFLPTSPTPDPHRSPIWVITTRRFR